MVELLVANEKVAGSNLVSRSSYHIIGIEEQPVGCSFFVPDRTQIVPSFGCFGLLDAYPKKARFRLQE